MLLKKVVANCYPLVWYLKAKLHFFFLRLRMRPWVKQH